MSLRLRASCVRCLPSPLRSWAWLRTPPHSPAALQQSALHHLPGTRSGTLLMSSDKVLIKRLGWYVHVAKDAWRYSWYNVNWSLKMVYSVYMLASHPQEKAAGKETKSKDVNAPPELSLPPTSGEEEKTKLVTQDTLDSASLSQTPSVSSEDPLSPVVRSESPSRSQKIMCLSIVSIFLLNSSQLQIVDQECWTLQRLM